MKKILQTLIISAALLFSGHTSFAQDSYGQNFWIAVPGNLNVSSPELYITAQANCSVTVSISSLSFSSTVSIAAGTLTKITLPASSQIQTSGISNLGVHITASSDVTVYLMNAQNASTDAYMALPVDALGMDYYVMGYTPDTEFSIPAQLTIVATENNTSVVINPTAPNSAGLTTGVTSTIILNQGQTYQIRSTNFTTLGDFTGSKVTSNKPIAVFGGNQCTNISGYYRACDHLIEQMPPTSAWGVSFVTSALATRSSGDVFRVLAQQNNTVVSINGVVKTTLSAGQFYETILSSNTNNRFTATKPILLGQFSRSSETDNVVSDPFFALVPPDDQFITDYIISSGTANINNNYLNITSPTSNTANVTLDGSVVNSSVWTPISGTSFSAATISVISGVHRVTSTLPIGVLAYGFGAFDSYGYLGGQSFSPVATVASFSLNLSLTTSIQAQEKCVIATVLDQNSNPVINVLVNFTVAGANNSSGFGFTNGLGQVTLCYNTCFAGQDILTATIAGLSQTVTINVASSTLTVSPSSFLATAGLQQCISATVKDGANIPVPNAFVNFTVGGTNAAAVVTVVTNASGIASFCYIPALAGADVISVSAGCTGGNSAVVNVTVTNGGTTCPPATVTITPTGLNAMWVNQGASDPYTFYYGLVNAKRLNAKIVGGVGPFGYSWSNSGTGTLLPRMYYPSQSIDLIEPTAATTVSVTVTDSSNMCQYMGTIAINVDDSYFCGKTGNTWNILICEGGITKCVDWNTGRNKIRAHTATLGPCGGLKQNISATTTAAMLVYPNPSNGLITVQFSASSYAKGSIVVTDMHGRTLMQNESDFEMGVQERQLDMTHFANGIYLIKVISGDDVKTEKIQILK